MVSSTSHKKQEDFDFEVEILPEAKDQPQKNHQLLYYLRFLLLGTFFGVLLTKGEVISWFRIQEMFRFQSFHMYGVISSAVIVGVVSVWLIKRFHIRSIEGEKITFPVKHFHKGQVFGGLLFGFGWALTGACPGPLFAQIGAGFSVVVIGLLSAIAGTWLYGALQQKLPH